MKVLNLYTTEIKNKSKAKGLFYDITYMSGNRIFSPNATLLTKYKMNQISDTEYTKEYIRLMKENIKIYTKQWDDLVNSEEVTLACYCKNQAFCHRYILVDILKIYCKYKNIKLDYKGDIL